MRRGGEADRAGKPLPLAKAGVSLDVIVSCVLSSSFYLSSMLASGVELQPKISARGRGGEKEVERM